MTKNKHTTKKLAGHTLWNITGFCLPMLAAFLSFPIMNYGVHTSFINFDGLGQERLYVVGLIWMLVGFFTLFDMGLGRALTKLIAENISLGKKEELPGLFWTAISMMFLFGLFTGLGMLLVAPKLSYSWINISSFLREETKQAFLVAAVGMPVVIMTMGLIGVLEACHKFKLINCIRIPMGTFTFIGPICVLPFTNNLFFVIAILVLGRIIECVFYMISCLYVLPELKRNIYLEKKQVAPLFSFGKWMTASNLTVALMTHVNRLLVGIIRTAAVGTNYFVPEEVVVRVLVIPRSWISALFPAFVDTLTNKKNDPSYLFTRGIKYLFLVMFPVSLAIIVLAPEGLAIWMGSEFATKSTFVMQCLTIGIFFHSMARVAWFFIQAGGRPDLSAKAHMIELPVYLILAWILIKWYGIAGAGIAWTLRVTVDMVLMFAFALPFTPESIKKLKPTGIAMIISFLLFVVCMSIEHTLSRFSLGLSILILFVPIAWRFILDETERYNLIKEIKNILLKIRV